MLVTVSANPVERVKRAYDYTPPEQEATGLFDVDNEIPDDDGGDISVSAISPDGNSYASSSVSASNLSNAFDIEKPEYTPKCCASCTCT